jgi:hypothetical protein
MKHFEELNNMTDYELREKLTGFGITLAIYCKQFYEVGSEDYKKLYEQLDNEIKPLKKRANSNLNKYTVDIEYKQKNKPQIFGYEGSYEERNEEEVKQRLKAKKWYNLETNKVIKPEFIKINILKTN